MTATGVDAFIIGSVFGFHLLQEYYGRDKVKQAESNSLELLVLPYDYEDAVEREEYKKTCEIDSRITRLRHINRDLALQRDTLFLNLFTLAQNTKISPSRIIEEKSKNF